MNLCVRGYLTNITVRQHAYHVRPLVFNDTKRGMWNRRGRLRGGSTMVHCKVIPVSRAMQGRDYELYQVFECGFTQESDEDLA